MYKEINMGDIVICDFCNQGEESMGGVMIGSYAVCGDCCNKHGYYDKHSDDVDEYFNREHTFKTNVLNYRLKTTGTTGGKIIIMGR